MNLMTQAQIFLQRKRLRELVALLFFALIGLIISLPLLYPGGEKAERFKAACVFIMFCRLAWHIHKGTFCFRYYFIYLAGAIGFCAWMDSWLTR